jgi:hypothetical protein
MKKTLLAILLFIGVTQSLFARESAPSPLLGRWSVDVSRLPIPPEARPRSVTITFGEPSAGTWTMSVDIVDAGGNGIHSVGSAALDGTATKVEGSPEADTAAFKMPEPGVLVLALGKGGIPASTRIYAVGADPGAMVETAVYFGIDGSPIMRTNYFTRVH